MRGGQYKTKVTSWTVQWASFYGGTSLLIAVGVILDTILQIDGHLTNKKYDTLTDYKSLQGRNQVNMNNQS